MSLQLKQLAMVFAIAALTACVHHKPQPETMQQVSAAVSMQAPAAQTMHVKHEMRGKDVLVECVIDHFSFTKGDKAHGNGHINVYLNGQKINEVFTAAFVLRGLPSGKHQIRLELVRDDESKYGVSSEFEVNIP
ncbi:hypothetical protein B6A27_06830 [Anoxybacillus sp. UARK-01]|uniref:hypothetical protein n=1 Tax=Anoxybacillus sp. UARK-01 TaxID=1895648 RepID=UPI0009BC0EBA|nr:hypothetical protein [Anoxybacillus sp. UARK-01]OQM46335.1 hypothetical protein B6A27_06830 [Anoxybacillus sp. UARK-01]